MTDDKYDKAIAYLTENPEGIPRAWADPSCNTPDEMVEAHCLFQYATPTGEEQGGCGCLTQIASNFYVPAWTPELTEDIRTDRRIPLSAESVGVEDLPVFAEWQRRLDKELDRV